MVSHKKYTVKNKNLEKRNVYLVNISTSSYTQLEKIRIGTHKFPSWYPNERKNRGLISFLNEVEYNTTDNSEIIDIEVKTDIDTDIITEFFKQFIIDTEKLISEHPFIEKKSNILIFNFIPLFLCRTLVDKILTGLYNDESIKFICKFKSIIFLNRNIDSFVKSKTFLSIENENKICTETCLIDIRGYSKKYFLDNFSKDLILTRSPYQQFLNTDPESIYRTLIYETNIFLGHYILNHSHVRTHYNLNEFILRDNVWEYLQNEFNKLILGIDKLLLIGAGIETKVIQKIGEQLKNHLHDLSIIDFIFQFEAKPEYVIPAKWSQKYDMTIVLGDIVNSGNTLKPWLEELIKKNENNKPIKLFSVAAMRNTPEKICDIPLHKGVTIKRDFYLNNEHECLLCKISQPSRKVKTVDDFYYVADEQITPYDFWEIVTDSKALLKNAIDPQGRQWPYRIDTIKIIKRYNHWLSSVIRDKYLKNWHEAAPSKILTVNERAGIAFSELVQETLEIPIILNIDRTNMKKISPNEGLPSDIEDPFEDKDKILIVDDGINTGNTILQLINFCKVTRGNLIGVLVLDNRLNDIDIQIIRNQMSRNHLVSLYNWPTYSKGV